MTPLKHRWVWICVGVLFLGALYSVRGILLPFIMGLLIAYFLSPVATKLEQKHLGRGMGAGLLIVGFFVLFIGSLLVALPFLKTELTRLAETLPLYGQQLYATLSPFVEKVLSQTQDVGSFSLNQSLHEQLSKIASWGLRLVVGLLTNTLALANLLSLIVLTPVIAFYALRDWPTIMSHLDRLLPRAAQPVIRDLFKNMNTVLAGYVRGQTLVCVILALYYSLALSLIGLKFSLTLGLIAGLFAFVPYFGFLVAISAALGVALTQHPGWMMTGYVAAIFLVGQIVESYVLMPKLVGDRIGLHPVWIIFALLAGGVLFGFMGLLFALPLAAALGVLVRFGVRAYQGSALYQGTEPTVTS